MFRAGCRRILSRSCLRRQYLSLADRRWSFLPDERGHLAEHLAEQFAGPDLEQALTVLEDACREAMQLDSPLQAEIERLAPVRAAYFEMIARKTDQLRTLLQGNPGFEDEQRKLVELAVKARERSTVVSLLKRRQGRGRRKFRGRNSVIVAVSKVYPPEAVIKSRGSHFALTIDILLRILGHDLVDPHSAIQEALRPPPRVSSRASVRRARHERLRPEGR